MRILIVPALAFIGLFGLSQANADPLQNAAKAGDSEKVAALLAEGAAAIQRVDGKSINSNH